MWSSVFILAEISYVNDYMFYKCDMNYYMLKQVLCM